MEGEVQGWPLIGAGHTVSRTEPHDSMSTCCMGGRACLNSSLLPQSTAPSPVHRAFRRDRNPLGNM